MPQIDIFSSPTQQLTYTTFSELRNSALKHEKAAYETLPHHIFLRFESVDDDMLALFPENANITTSRLLLGYSEYGFKGVHKPACAYIYQKEQVHQVFLRFGDRRLKTKNLDEVKWEKPFNLIYDAYGQTQRAAGKIKTMAAFYFLATNRISEFATRTDGFVQTFNKLCDKIHVQDANGLGPPEAPTRNSKLGDDPSNVQTSPVNLWSGEKCTSDLLLPELLQQEITGEQDFKDEGSKLRQDKSGMQVLAVNYQIDNKGDRSTIPPLHDQSSCISSPTIWDDLNSPPAEEVPRDDSDLFLEPAQTAKEELHSKLQKTAEARQTVKTENKVLDIDDLSTFVRQFKQLMSENAMLQQHKSTAATLQALVDRTKHDAEHASTQLQSLQVRYLDKKTEAKELHKTVSEATARCKALTHDLGREQAKSQETQRELDVVQAENQRLAQRLAEAERNSISEQEVAEMEISLQALQADKKSMQDRVRVLEAEIQEERNKFDDYKRKIRALSMDA